MKNRRIIYPIVLILIIVLVFSGVFWSKSKNLNDKKGSIALYNYFILYKEGLLGVIDKQGNIIIEPAYDYIQIPNPREGVFICYYSYQEEIEEYQTKVLNQKR